MTIARGSLGGTAAVVIAACLFGTLGPASRAAYAAGLTPLAFTFWRAAIGTVALAALLALLHLRGRSRVRWRALPPRALAALLLAGGTALVLNLAIFSAFERMSIALALLGFYTYPAFVAGAAVALGEERLTRMRAVALALALAGMALVVLGGASIFSFALVMTIGVFFGTLSSWFIAAPLLLAFQKRESKKARVVVVD